MQSLLIAAGSGALITTALAALDFLVHLFRLRWVDSLLNLSLWPIWVCERLVGPGPRLGGGHEGTPVQVLAAFIGIALAWCFYSVLFLFILEMRKRNRSSSSST